jgi:hypothetical protein
VLQPHFDAGELFGATPAEAYSVDTTSVNTSQTLAAGQLNARVGIRVSPMAEFVYIDVVKTRSRSPSRAPPDPLPVRSQRQPSRHIL